MWIRLLCIIAVLSLSSQLGAESISLDFGDNAGGVFSRIAQLVALVSLLSLAPALVIMVTSFTRIVIVMSFLRTAMGTQQSPPNMVLTSLALFLTMFVMAPTFETMYEKGIQPLMENKMKESEAIEKSIEPLKGFMLRNVRQNDLKLFFDLSKTEVPDINATPLRVLVPAFMISEIRRAFEIGFMIFLPFLVIDMVVASVLMSMGMMMLPPVMIATPFKIIFFVLVDGWNLLCSSLVSSFN
jgi:flagellar biosynthetic protein FliP